MKLSDMFKKPNQRNYEVKIKSSSSPEIPEGLWKKCNACKAAIMTEDVKSGYYICPKCGHYFRIGAMERINMITDVHTFEEWAGSFRGLSPQNAPAYRWPWTNL